MPNTIEAAAALERLDVLTTAFLERDDIAAFIDGFLAEGLCLCVSQMLAVTFQYGFLAGHREGLNHVDETIVRTIDNLLGKEFDAH